MIIISIRGAAYGGRMDPHDETEAATGVTVSMRPALDVAQFRQARRRPDGKRVAKTSERVALAIVHDIVAHGLHTGDRLLLEAAMTERYGVSRASLREALRLLEVQGLINIRPGPGGGPVVGSVDPANLARGATLYFHLGAATYDHLLDAQVLFEPICAELAAHHPDRRAVMKPYERLGLPPTEPEYRQITDGFHRAVYRLAANPVVVLLTEAVTHIVTSHVVSTMDPRELRPAIVDEHGELARAIAGGQAVRARRLMAEHFAVQHAYYRAHWPARLNDLVEWR
jgi:GntR family transcriptional regulator, transcriptional repressor for pyruvate dehydrogenase complex